MPLDAGTTNMNASWMVIKGNMVKREQVQNGYGDKGKDDVIRLPAVSPFTCIILAAEDHNYLGYHLLFPPIPVWEQRTLLSMTTTKGWWWCAWGVHTFIIKMI